MNHTKVADRAHCQTVSQFITWKLMVAVVWRIIGALQRCSNTCQKGDFSAHSLQALCWRPEVEVKHPPRLLPHRDYCCRSRRSPCGSFHPSDLCSCGRWDVRQSGWCLFLPGDNQPEKLRLSCPRRLPGHLNTRTERRHESHLQHWLLVEVILCDRRLILIKVFLKKTFWALFDWFAPSGQHYESA